MVLSSIAGVVICGYAFFAISESAKHIKNNWDAANRCMNKIEGLNQLVSGKDKQVEIKEEKWYKACKICNQLRIIVGLFLVSFVSILIWGCVCINSS